MVRLFRSCVAASAALALLVPSSRAATLVVEMTTVDGEPTFVPASITVEAGDTVRWVNTDLHLEHSVTSGSGSADPGSGVDFSSPLLRLGEYFEHTFPFSGDYEYYSIPHEYEGMFGIVHVGTATPVPTLETSTWGKLKQGFSDLLPRD